jgi:hypothetical protein
MKNQMLCLLCAKPMSEAEIQEARNEHARFEKKLVHTDCYYEAMSCVIEKSPIHVPGLALATK